jgi:eukaryotic-like serine/threonine-protein kinase
MTTRCPSREELALIGSDAYGGSCPSEIADHLECCPECRDLLRRCAEGGGGSLPPPSAKLPAGGKFPHIDGFAIERELGRGSMGVVYLASRNMPKRQVALKLLPGGRRASARERKQWLREAQAAASLRHPGIVTLHEAREADDWFLLVLEYISGGTLADRLNAPFPPAIAARLVETVASAVHYIHVQGQLHLDLKPSNILLDGDAGGAWDAIIPKVSDFGIARQMEPSATDTGSIGPGGTPSYMAPEQITRPRKEMTARADIHGLGAILYHLLTGRPPYQGATVLETVDLVKRQEPVPPRRLNPRIPRDLEIICLKCLHKDPLRRYPSSASLAIDLRSWLDGRPISARPVSMAEKTWRSCRRRPVIAALAAMLVLTISVSFVTVFRLWRQAEADYQMSAEMVGELTDVVAGGDQHQPRTMTPDLVFRLLKKHRKRLLILTARRPDDLLLASRLARVEFGLSVNLVRDRRDEEARVILLGALRRIENILRRHPLEDDLRGDERECLVHLHEASERLGKSEEVIFYLRRLLQWSEENMRRAPRAEALAELITMRRHLAWSLLSRGDCEQADSLLAANQRALDHPPAGCEGHYLPLERLLSHIDSSEMHPVAAPAASRDLRNGKSSALCALSRLASPTDASQSPGDWAALAAEVLRSDDPDPHAAARMEAMDALEVGGDLSYRAARLRKSGNVEEARLVAERMLALGNYFVESHPDQPASHLALSDAYAQMYKNAYRVDDYRAIEGNMKLAYDAARRAASLDPESERARVAVDDLRRKLVELTPKG